MPGIVPLQGRRRQVSTTYTQLPGTMSFALKRGDDFATSIDFGGVSLVGYTVTSTLTSLVTGGAVSPITTSITDAAAAVVAVSLTDTQTASLAAGTYGWRLDWFAPGGVQRTALQGVVEVYA
jgi:hypothetical protein